MKMEEIVVLEQEREEVIRAAVNAADRVLLKGCHGDQEDLALLTAEVAKAFAEKTCLMLRSELNKKEMLPEAMPWEMEDE
jgi:hypothetical protein